MSQVSRDGRLTDKPLSVFVVNVVVVVDVDVVFDRQVAHLYIILGSSKRVLVSGSSEVSHGLVLPPRHCLRY